ncbi:hypothetical protein G3N95_01645 [Paraburkholderia sp. Tr-20389]|uniref:TrfB-related DNA-binding protein n=1 Tax=Paraburkholderia sp. Tr-20389 TaxID=2703903 RepID=UPI00198102A0|nr:TrfB-related DNA-binding protein [Paraburkholderia sp. Tr-20389]MBN3751626.1 hypothetical protein [Paraburkholderia sp. Tr-20389]
MSAREFKTLSPRLKRMTLGNVEIARRVLVDGVAQNEAALECGLTAQRVNFIVKTVLATARDIPQGWQQVEVWLPPELAARVREMERKARAKADRENNV